MIVTLKASGAGISHFHTARNGRDRQPIQLIYKCITFMRNQQIFFLLYYGFTAYPSFSYITVKINNRVELSRILLQNY